MAVTISTGEITGTRHVVRTSTGKVYVVMENAGVVEVWAGAEAGAAYYFDASDVGPDDDQGVWSNDGNGFNGSTSDFARTTTQGSTDNNALEATGTNAPGSGTTIIGGQGRLYAAADASSQIVVNFQDSDGGTSLALFGSAVGQVAGWGNWGTFSSEPSAGWSWAALQALAVDVYLGSGSGGDIYKIDVRPLHHSSSPIVFLELDSSNKPSCIADSPIGVAIDSDDVLSICYYAGAASAFDLDIVTFATVDSTAGTDTFGTPEEAISCEDADNTTYGCGVAVDANDDRHCVAIGSDADMGQDKNTLWYDNDIGGSFADRREIEGVSGPVNVDYPDITVTTVPLIVYVNTDDGTLDAVEGDALDPTTFATREVDASVTTGVTNKPSICADTNGRVWVAYVDSDGTIDIAGQSGNWTDAWTVETNGNSGKGPSIVTKDIDDAVFASLDGDSQFFYRTDADFPESGTSGDFTIQATIKPPSIAASGTIAAKYYADTANRLFIFSQSNAELYMAISSNGVTTVAKTTSSVNLQANVWQHVAAVYDISAGTVDFYLNGIFVEQETGYGTAVADVVPDFMIGALGDHADPGSFYEGGIFNVALFSDMRTAAEIKASYLNPSEDLSGAGNIIAAWQFDDAAAATAIDNAQGDAGRDLIPYDAGDTTFGNCGRTVGSAPYPEMFVFYEEDASDDIVYDNYDSFTDSWLGETALQTSVAYNSVKARWAFLNLAPLQTYGIDYIFQRDSDGVVLWDVLDISPAEAYVPQIMMII